MGHELEIVDGVPQFVWAGRTPPWHKLGTNVAKAMTAADAMNLAGLDWDVEKTPVKADWPKKQWQGEGAKRKLIEVPTEIVIPDVFACIRRSDDPAKDGTYLGNVGGRYHVVNPQRTFEFFDKLRQSEEAYYETAGALRDGREIFMSGLVPKVFKIGDSEVQTYLMLRNTYDRSGMFEGHVSKILAVCANTVEAAIASASRSFKFPHTTSIEARLEQAELALSTEQQYTAAWEPQAQLLLDTPFDKDGFVTMVKKLFPVPPGQEETRIGQQNTEYRSLLVSNWELTDTLADDAKKTAWGGYNVLTEAFDWQRKVQKQKGNPNAPLEKRIYNSQWGENVGHRTRAWDYLLEFAGGTS